ncbi:tyrosine-protein phosphatase [Sphingobium yanoikuyae]|uniref:tyrosine-protein phosphatase n=1 Tax=Sphingobium yanoikuyae TaxID=13690 RepID=UPI0028A6B3AA|nr:tyrosine-protein phosphatase [Sphingobium yanoikuyae]
MTISEIARFSRILPVEGGLNLRDMGGYVAAEGRRVKTGVIYRSGQMANLSPAGAAHMAALGIRSIVDFRRQSECAAQPTAWHLGTGTDYWSSAQDVLSGELDGVVRSNAATADAMRTAMLRLYRGLPHKHVGSYRHMFSRLAGGHVPLLFNCAAGKDRTGVAAALILHALGASRDMIFADYLLTNDADLSSLIGSKGRFRRLPDAVREALLIADAGYLDALFSELETAFGGVDAYLTHALGVDATMRTELRNVLLE